MKSHYLLFALMTGILLSSCSKEDPQIEPCQFVRYEITGDTTQLDSVSFILDASGLPYRDVQRSHVDLNIPFAETVQICKQDYDFNLRCYNTDTTLTITLKVFRDGVLIRQKTGRMTGYDSSGLYYLELAAGIND